MPRFADYHRTVVGYHGTKSSIARAIVADGKPFAPSKNASDWLGHGIYFWEYAPKQAWKWANQRAMRNKWSEPVAVVAAMIRLGNCLDLLDPDNAAELQGFYRKLKLDTEAASGKLPANHNANKRLDCTVLEYTYAALETERNERVETCRAVYSGSETRLWPRSWLSEDAHIQLCVREPKCILGAWLVPEMKG